MNYMNSVLTSARSHLQGQGAGIQFDQNGNQIDYSCRPIDQIFRRAREELSHSPSNLSVSAASAGGAVNAASLSLSQVSNTNVSNVASIPSTTSNGENTLTTSTIGGDLGVLSRTCLIGISDTNRRGSIGAAQQLASAQQMTVQQPVPLSTALYPGNLTPQQLQQHYFQLQQQQQQLQQIQQLQAQLQQQQQLQQGTDNNTSLDGNKKRVSSGTGSEEGPSAKSARSSLGNSSGIESTQDRQAWTTSSADLVVDTKNVQCSSAGPEQLEKEEMSNNDNPINIVDGNISSDSSKQKLNENIEEDDFNGNDENNLINVVVQDNEDINEGERAAAALEQGINNTSILTNNIRAQDEGIDSPSNGKQLRIVEDEEDDQ